MHPTAPDSTRSTVLVTLLALLAWGLVPLAPPAAHAQDTLVLEVTTTDDLSLDDEDVACPAEGDDECSLRAAIETAEDADGPDEVVIELEAATYGLDHEDGQLVLDGETPTIITGEGSDATVIDADDLDDRILHAVDADLTIRDVALVNGDHESSGGALSAVRTDLTIERSLLADNVAEGGGGAISALSDVDVHIVDSTIRDNSANNIGGGILLGGELLVERSTFTGNTLDGNVAGGGALGFALGQNFVGGSATFVNSTIHDNEGGTRAGGIRANNEGTVALTNSTVTGNTLDDPISAVSEPGYGMRVESGSEIVLDNTIVADNGDGDCGTFDDGAIVTEGHNLDSDGTCDLDAGEGDVIEGDADLSPLGDHRGFTHTRALGADSDAVHAGDTDLTEDQRGEPRPVGGVPDIGAYESQEALAPGCDWEWTGTQDDSWHEDGNWTGPDAGTPGEPGDTVCIETDQNLPVVHDDGDTTVATIVDADDPDEPTLEVADGTLTLTGPTDLDGGLTLLGEELVIDDDLAVHGPVVFGGGTLTGDGATTLTGDVEFTEIEGQTFLEEHDLTLTGDTEVERTPRFIETTAANTGELELLGTAGLAAFGSDEDSRMTNEGLVLKPETGFSTITVPFDNADGATVRTEAGTLNVNRGGQSHGDWEIAEGAVLSQGLNVIYEHTSDSTILGDIVGDDRGGELRVRQRGLSVAEGTQVEVGHISLDGELVLDDGEVSSTTLEATNSSWSRLLGDGLVEVAEDATIERGELLDDTVLEVGGDLVFPDFSDFVAPDVFVDATATVAGGIRHEDGDVEVGPTGQMSADGGYLHTQGLLLLDEGTVPGGYDALEDAQIEGNGTVGGNLVSDGVVNPTLPPEPVVPPPGEGAAFAAQSAADRTMTSLGDYAPEGTLEIHVDGADPGQFDRLDVAGQAILAGTLDVTVDDDADLQPGDEMEIVLAEQVTGEFDLEELPELEGDDQLSVDYRDQAVVLLFGDPPTEPEPDPEPSRACPDGEVPPAGFGDVPPSSVHAPAIDCIAWYGITLGTTATTYEPGGTVTRAQKASFVARMLDTAGKDLPDVEDHAFDDIAGSTHAPAISQLAELGIVEGDGQGTFAPSSEVTRSQSASMIVRAVDLVLDEPLPAPAGPFTDTAGSVHEEAIDAAAAAGITHGVTPTTFEPGADTRRDQMASLLARTLEVLADDGIDLASP